MKITQFTVEGKGAFPTDMLRYDSCWPTDTESALNISVNREDREYFRKSRKVNLATYGNYTIARWESFMWRVI